MGTQRNKLPAAIAARVPQTPGRFGYWVPPGAEYDPATRQYKNIYKIPPQPKGLCGPGEYAAFDIATGTWRAVKLIHIWR